jgi:glutaryl-CoA dehydrogenase (non-decarboxylating)
MNFDLTEEQAAMERMARNFAEKEIVPSLKKEEFDRELVRQMGNLGLFGTAFPEGMGGSACGFLAHSVVCETISTYDSGLRALFNLQAMTVPYTMMEWGKDSVRRKHVKALVSGEKLGCTCFSEPNAGSDIAAVETKVVDKGDHYLINGAKTWISNGTVAEVAVVYCTYDRSLKHKGLCAIVVETNQPGWQPHEIPKLGD